ILILLNLGSIAQPKPKHNATHYFELGENALDRKEYVTAQAHFTECLRLDPSFADAYRLRAITREHLKDVSRALTDYNIYVSLKPDDPEVLFNRAVLRFESDQILPARQDFLQLLKMPRQETNMVYFSQEKYSDAGGKVFTYGHGGKENIYNYLGLIETKTKRYDKAIMWFDSALRFAPGNPSYLINRGITRLESKDIAGARADFAEALKQDPDNALAIHNLAVLKSFEGQTESEKLLTDAIEKNKNLPYPRAERAFYRMHNNDLAGALQDYNELVRMEPTVAEGYLNRGFVKERLKDLEGALQDFSKAISLDEKNPKAWLGRGNVMSKVGKWKEAVEDYTVAIGIDPDYNLAYYNRAMALSNSKKMEDACRDLKAAEKRGMTISPQVKVKICR
ncbi:MAG TPA: tetratricopeptide repeat protein, partial [Cyclobacteriaceae bacterium]|nr:tetratricopeptide repeat protein [Cyclobacteriaceae bacterium]